MSDVRLGLVVALAMALGGCSLLRSSDDFRFSDAGADARPADGSADAASDASDAMVDATLDAAECAVATDCPATPRLEMRCRAGVCERVGCEPDWADCDGDAANGCEVDLTSSVDHCGGCGVACELSRAIPRCAAGECVLDVCRAGFGDCNGAPSDGCEADLSTSASCGSCSNVCTSGELCDATTTPPGCALDCAASVCGSSCVDTTSDASNCGACDVACPLPAGAADTSCVASICAFSCLADRADCDADAATGCEVDLTNDVAHCGACALACDPVHGSVACASRACVVTSCDSGFADCDMDGVNGCEVELATDAAHCGGCGNACASGAECVAGACDPVVAGDSYTGHTCVLRRSGRVVCWGRNTAGQADPLTAPTPVERGVTLRVDASASSAPLLARAVATGGVHSCVIDTSAKLLCWGVGNAGQLGDGTTVRHAVPAAVTSADAAFSGRSFVALAAGWFHSCAIDDVGEVWCWGHGSSGQTGTGALTTQATRVAGVSGAASLALGQDMSCARLTDGTVSCWGGNALGQLGRGSNTPATSASSAVVTGLSGVSWLGARRQTVCALTGSGDLKCWGGNGAQHYATDTRPGWQRWFGSPQLVDNGVSRAWLNFYTVCRRKADGTHCAGRNLEGNIGNGTTLGAAFPGVLVPELDGVEPLFSGDVMNCGLRGTELVCWGSASYGGVQRDSLLLESATPLVDLGGAPQMALVQVSLGPVTGCGVLSTGGAICWGNQPHGDGTVGFGSTPVAVSTLANVRDLAAGTGFVCAIEDRGGSEGTQAYCWGGNGSRQLGRLGGAVLVPEQVALAGQEEAIAVGYAHACALSSGQVYCWGSNESGQLGRDTGGAPDVAGLPVPGLTDATAVATGRGYSCAIRADGSVVCWGFNSIGQLGDGSNTNRSAPVAVSGLRDAIALGLGAWHSCAVRSGGGVVCWGAGDHGQLGDGRVRSSFVPVAVISPGVAAVDVAAGENHSCAVYADGTLRCWGRALRHQLGLGSTAQVDAPAVVPGVSMAVEVEASFDPGYATVVRRADGSALCFGYDAYGVCGTGSEVFVLSPTVQVLP